MILEPKNTMADEVDVVFSGELLSITKEGHTIYLDNKQVRSIANIARAYSEAKIAGALALLIDTLSPEAWESLPQYVQDKVMAIYEKEIL